MEIKGINIQQTKDGLIGSIQPNVLIAFLSQLKSSPTGKIYFRMARVKEPTERLTHRLRLRRESLCLQPADTYTP